MHFTARHTAAMIAAAAAITVAMTGCTATSTAPSQHPTSTAPALPASFPTDLPLLPGTILNATGDRADGWTVTVRPTYGALTDAEAALKKVGYSVTSASAAHATLAGPDYTVFLQTPGKSVTYVVTAAH